MKIIELQQGSTEWLSYRRNGIGASDIPAIMKKCPYRTPMDVYKEKKGMSEPKVNAFMQRGSFYEQEARELFENHIGAKFPPLCAEHQRMPHHRASLDGYNGSYNEILEIKIPGRKNYEKMEQNILPENYSLQVQWQMHVTGANLGYLMAYYPEIKEYQVINIKKDHELIDDLIEEANLFWNSLKNNHIPELLDSDFTDVEDMELRNLCNQYVNLKKNLTELGYYEKKLKSQILDRCKNKKTRCFGFRINRKEVVRFDYKSACMENHLPLEKYKKEPTVSWVIDELGT